MRQLFGAYHPPEGSGRRGVVLCYPWGRECLNAHATYRHLARLLCAEGLHVLRFDYFGTGDSAGDFTEASQDQWLADIDTAIEELKQLAQISHVDLVGMRYGATLAATTARVRADVNRLVLWDPIVDGQAYLTELGVPRDIAPAADVDVCGVVCTPGMRAAIGAIRIGTFGAPLPRTLVLDTQESELGNALQEHLVRDGVESALQFVPARQAWHDDAAGAAGMPVAAIRSVVAWLS